MSFKAAKNLSMRYKCEHEKFLTEKEREYLRSQHPRERDKQVCDRIKAELLNDKGWTLMQIAEVLLLTAFV